MKFEGRVIIFATNNVNKFNEARRVLAEFNIAVGMLRVKCLEVQSDSLEEIAVTSVVDAFRRCKLPIIVEDAGLFVEGLNGFPGPYAAYAYKTIGNDGLLRLLQGVAVRKARFESVVAYFSSQLDLPVCFCGSVGGEIVTEEKRGNNNFGFGFDPIFRPSDSERTFAEMDVTEKNLYSHRANALRKFGGWYEKIVDHN